MGVRTRAQAGLLWRQWDDEYVVYNPASGDSHLLDLLTAQGLQRLEARPMSASELVEDLSLALQIPADEALEKFVARLFSELLDLGLTFSADS